MFNKINLLSSAGGGYRYLTVDVTDSTTNNNIEFYFQSSNLKTYVPNSQSSFTVPVSDDLVLVGNLIKPTTSEDLGGTSGDNITIVEAHLVVTESRNIEFSGIKGDGSLMPTKPSTKYQLKITSQNPYVKFHWRGLDIIFD